MLLQTEQKCIVEFLNRMKRKNGTIMYIDTFNFNLSRYNTDINTISITIVTIITIITGCVYARARARAWSLEQSIYRVIIRHNSIV